MDKQYTNQAVQHGATPLLVRHAKPEHADTVLVDWMLGNRCNFACSYCPAKLHDGSIKWQDKARISLMMRRLAEHYQKGMGQNLWLQFTGGEPTLHPNLRDILDEASGLGFSISLISNGSRTLRFWESITRYLDAIVLTYHLEFVDHFHFVKLVTKLANVMPVHVNVTALPERFDEAYGRSAEIAERFPDVSVSFKPLREDFGDKLYPYTPEQIARLKTRLSKINRASSSVPRSVVVREFSDGSYDVRRPNDLIVAGQNRWQGMICSAGLESLRIDGNGQVTRAVCGMGGPLGQLGEKFDLPVSPIRCSKESCGCISDILITKRKLQRLGL